MNRQGLDRSPLPFVCGDFAIESYLVNSAYPFNIL